MIAPADARERVLDRESLLRRYGRPRRGTLVFTNGCFDLLHRGHVEVLQQARALGDALVVAVNTDESVRALKGPGRPIIAEHDRAFILASLACVDAVTLFHEPTPRELIAELLPDVLVKGGDYAIDQVVGAAEVQAAGGRVIVLPYVAGRSTTDIVQRIRKEEHAG